MSTITKGIGIFGNRQHLEPATELLKSIFDNFEFNPVLVRRTSDLEFLPEKSFPIVSGIETAFEAKCWKEAIPNFCFIYMWQSHPSFADAIIIKNYVDPQNTVYERSPDKFGKHIVEIAERILKE